MTTWRRIAERLRVARRFAAAGTGPMDRVSLFRGGVARHRPFDGPSPYARLGRLGGAVITPRIRQARGQRVQLDLRELTGLILFEEVFLDAIYPLERVNFTPAAIVDCGACEGFFSLLAHARFPGVPCHAFEPQPQNVARLRRNFALNGLTATVHAAAVGVAEGRALFHGEGFGGHLAAAHTAGASEVRVVNLATFLTGLAAPRLLLKIDIEGAEAELLPALAARLPEHTAIFLETHHPEPVWRSYLEPLRAAGFARCELRRHRDAGAEYVEHFLLRAP